MSLEKFSAEEQAAYLTDWAQRVSRRGLLARVGNLALKIAGVSLVPFLPVNRVFAQFGCSSDWQTCGMHGFFCTACCGGGASYSTCPACTIQSGFWTGCCPNPASCGPGTTIRYYDCCGTAGGYSSTDAAACTGSECPPGGGNNTVAYCGGNGLFRCTIIVNTGSAC